MKLRLPNKLIVALLSAAAPALFSTLSTATLGTAVVAMAGLQASAGWAGSDYYILGNNEVISDTDAAQASSPLYFSAGYDAQTSTGLTLSAKDGAELHFRLNTWHTDWTGVDHLTFESLSFRGAAAGSTGKGSLSLDDAIQNVTIKTVNGSLGTLNVAASAALTLGDEGVTQQVAADNLTVGAGASLTINRGTTLNVSSSSPSIAVNSIHGNGTISFNNGLTNSIINTSNHLVADDWTGTVVLKNVTGVVNLNLNNYSTSSSAVQLIGVSGHLCSGGNWTYAGKLILGYETGESVDAFTHTNGYWNAKYTFSGEVVGTGNMVNSRGGEENTAFSGDISGWTGAYINKSSSTSKLYFSGNANEVNAAIRNESGSTYLTAETSVTFNKEVRASQFVSVTAGQTLTFNADVTIDNTNPFEANAKGAYNIVLGNNVTAMFGQGGQNKTSQDNFAFNVTVGEGSTLHLRMTDTDVRTLTGNYLFKNNSTFFRFDGGYKFTGDVTFGETTSDKVLLNADWNKNGTEFAGLVAGHGTLHLLGPSRGGSSDVYTFSGDNGTFDGEVLIGKGFDNTMRTTNLVISSETALQKAHLNATANGHIQLGATAATIAGLDGTSGATLGLVSDTAASALTLNTAENSSYTYAGSIAAGISLIKSGAGKQTLSGDMSAFNGSVTLSGGQLSVTATRTDTKGTLNDVTIAQGATLELQNVNANTASGSGDTYKQKLEGNLTIGSGATFTVTQTDSLKYSANAENANTITVAQGGTLAFGDKRWTVGTNNHIVMAGGTVTGTGDGDGALDFYQNNTLRTTADSDIAATLRFRSGTATFDVDASKTLTLTGNIIGGATMNHTGTGTVKVTGSLNSFTGTLSATEGVLSLQNSSDVASSASLKVDGHGTINLGGGVAYQFSGLYTTNGGDRGAHTNVNIADGTTLQLTGNGGSFAAAADGENINISGSGKFIIDSKHLTIESVDGKKTAHFYVPENRNNGGGKLYTYQTTTGSNIFVITDAKVSVGGTVNTTINNTLTNSDVVNTGTGTLTVDYADNTVHGLHAENGAIIMAQAAHSAETLDYIKAEGGDVTIKGLGNAVTANLNELFIADSRTVSMYQDGNATTEANVSVSGTLKAGSGATLNANLTVNGGATIDVDHTTGGLHMGSTLTFAGGEKMHVSDNIIAGLNSLSADLAFGGSVTLFSGVDAFTIGGSSYDAGTTYHASDYFNLAGVNRPWDFVIKYEANAADDGGTVSLYMETPEPATATLSLLALAALAAKRKRK